MNEQEKTPEEATQSEKKPAVERLTRRLDHTVPDAQ